MTIIDEFILQTADQPDLLAIEDERRSLSYAGFDRETNRVANAILASVGPGQEPVAVLLEPSVDAVVAVFGVLKAGKIRLSLDPQAPPGRQREILEHAGVGVVVTDTAHRPSLAEVQHLSVVDLAGTKEASERNPAVQISSDSAATIFYTSGSSGRPKGVVITHAGEMQPPPRADILGAITPDDRVAVLHDLSFSASRRAITHPLLVGASVHMFDLRRLGAGGLGTWLEEKEITWLQLPLPLLTVVAQQRSGIGPLHRLRYVSVGGDHVYRDNVRAFLEAVGPQCLVVHGYGSTEAGAVTQLPIRDPAALTEPVLPAGRPAAGVRIELKEVEPDGVGRLMISSPRLAAGYWREPEMTARAFLEDPEDPGARWFVTEDMGRIRPDGMLELRGRVDGRVKVRGYGVDLSEVERAVAGLDGVKETVVLLDSSEPARPRLVAYVVPADGARPIPSLLRRALLELLPPYMIPAAFVVLDALPVTERGKTDRGALPRPPGERPVLETPWAGPRDDMEAVLAGVWERVLRVRPVGIHDDFYALGGDSLLMTDAAIAASEALGRDVPFALFLEGSTVAEAASLLRRGRSRTLSTLVPLQPEGSLPPLFLVHGGGGEAIEFARLASLLAPDQPVYAFQVRGARGRRALGSVERLASYYLRLLREVEPSGPHRIAGYSFGTLVAYEMARRLHSEGQPPEVLLLLDTPAPGAGRRKPPERVALHTWLRRRVMLAPFLVTDRPIPTRWRIVYPFERSGRAARMYRPGRYTGRVALIRSEQRAPDERTNLGWGALIDGEIHVAEIPGDHNSILQAPDVRGLAERVRSILSQTQPPSSASIAASLGGMHSSLAARPSSHGPQLST